MKSFSFWGYIRSIIKNIALAQQQKSCHHEEAMISISFRSSTQVYNNNLKQTRFIRVPVNRKFVSVISSFMSYEVKIGTNTYTSACYTQHLGSDTLVFMLYSKEISKPNAQLSLIQMIINITKRETQQMSCTNKFNPPIK